jgi:hypothetical protein
MEILPAASIACFVVPEDCDPLRGSAGAPNPRTSCASFSHIHSDSSGNHQESFHYWKSLVQSALMSAPPWAGDVQATKARNGARTEDLARVNSMVSQTLVSRLDGPDT